jgi:hypothetical protein
MGKRRFSVLVAMATAAAAVFGCSSGARKPGDASPDVAAVGNDDVYTVIVADAEIVIDAPVVVDVGEAVDTGVSADTAGIPDLGALPEMGNADTRVPDSREAGIDNAVETGPVVSDGTGACTVDGWCWVYPLPHGNTLRAIWGASASDIWAVGDGGTLMHWDGVRWSTTLGDTRQRWFALWGSSATDVWVVGLAGAIQRFNGTAWQTVAIGTTEGLTSIWGTGTGTVFVGVDKTGGIWRSDNGGAFTQTLSNRYVAAIHGSAANDVWSVGRGSTIHWDGSKWSDIAVWDRSTAWPLMTDVLVNGPNDVWATCEDCADHVFHYDGGIEWKPVKLPLSIPLLTIAGVGAGGSEMWVAGRGGALRWTAASGWVAESGIERDTALTSIWAAVPGEPWAVTTSGGILHRTPGGTWTTVSGRATPVSYGSLSGSAPDDLWATGSLSIGHFDGRVWTDITLESLGAAANPFGPMLALARDDVWSYSAGAEDTLLYHFDGTAWSRAGKVTGFVASDIWGGARDDIWMVSRAGSKARYDGKTWSLYNQPPYPAMWRIAGANPNDIWAVGDYFSTLHWNGQSWSAVPSAGGASQDILTTICVSSAGEAWTGGSDAQLYHWLPGGSSWTKVTEPLVQWVNACTVLPDSTMWAAAASGAPWGGDFVRWDGTTFRTENSGLGDWIKALWSTGSSSTQADVWAVGGGGVVRRASKKP